MTLDDALRDLDAKLKSIGKKTFPEPRPVYTKNFKKYNNRNYTNPQKKNNDELIKNTKIAIHETKKTIKALHGMIKNRKINKLEKEALQTKAEADKLAHEIKTKTALVDSINDIKRYQKEKEKIDLELEQARKEEQ